MGSAQGSFREVSAVGTVSGESIQWACKRMEEFYAIHKNGGFVHLTEAVDTLLESVGLTGYVAEDFCTWVDEFVGDGYDIPVSLGLLIGLLAADHEKW